MSEKQVNLRAKLSYGVGDVFGGGAFLILSLFFLNFLTDVELMAPIMAGSIVMLSKIWDAAIDPFIGMVSDKTKSRFGRRRIFFLIGSLPVFISFVMVWYDFGITDSIAKYLYFLFAYIFFSTSFSIVMVPYNSILPDMVSDYKTRTSYSSIRMGFSVFSAILSGVIPGIIINTFTDDKKFAYLIMALIFGAMYGLCWIIVFFGTWERKDISYIKPEKNVFANFLSVFQNKSFRIHIGMFLTGQGSVDVLTAMFIYYLTNVIGKNKQYSFVLGVLLITQLISLPIHTAISKKYGKTAPYKFGLPLWLIAMTISAFITKSSPVYLIYLVAFLCGIGCASTSFVPYSILPDISDVDELITGQRREGIYSGMVTFIRQAVNGITIGLVGVALQLIGYNTQVGSNGISQYTISGIRYLFVFIPIVLLLTTLVIASRFKLSESNHKIILNEINYRNEHGCPPPSDNENIKICENVTGVSYDKLWKGARTTSVKN